MRLNKKNQIMDLTNTIEEGIDYSYNSSNENAKVMLQDCKNGLEFLSSLLLQESQEINENIQATIETIRLIQVAAKEHPMFVSSIERIKIMLNELRQLIVNKIETEIEIAFMPYKSAMWDSLDSIYKEASNDPQCSCYVVPIPYYEKNYRGEIVTFNYEGNQFPEYVNIIPFELYNFEEQQPDIIYIHNPFDEYNKLTMVNPRFFTSNLKKYTDMLVYVPYYVLGNSESPSLNVLPSYNNITKIIVQSELTRNAFISNGISSDKILSLGSPKIDAMLSLDGEQIKLPNFWSNTIFNKKVFLLNTGLADLLSVDKWFEHVEEVINYFITDKKSILIWRQHPLTDITLKTLRPNLINKLEDITLKLNQTNNIIIDTSSNIYPAVSISDAIISDYSSVLIQYIATGKPVLGLLDAKMIEEEKTYYADYLGCYFINRDKTIDEFIKMVKLNEDNKKEERVNRFKQSLCNSDGTSGKKIHFSIKQEVLRNILMIEQDDK